ncbi:hypothetical protein ACFS07_01580 [Undibacterium arcticum]
MTQIQQTSVAAKEAAPQNAKSASTISQPPGEGLIYKNSSDSVRLYGLIDLTGVHKKNNADKAGNTVNDMPVAWFSGNRWGIEGEHALKDTDGLKAIFQARKRI